MASEKELKIKITANSQQFLSSIKGVNSSLDGLIANFSKFNLSTVGVVAGLAALGGSLATIVKSTANYGDELFNTSQKIGISVEALSGLQYAAGLANIEHETLTTGIKKLSTAVVESSKELKALGISQSELKTLSTDELLLRLADRFRQMEDGAGKTALAVKLFGRSGIELIPLLNEGSAGIKRMTDEAKSFGLVIDEKAAAAADQFNDNLDRMKGLVMGITVSIGNELIPKINSLVQEMENAAKSEGWKILTPQGIGSWAFKKGEKLGSGEWTGGVGRLGAGEGPKVKAPEVIDDAAQKKEEDANRKRLENMEKWATQEFKFVGESWDFKWRKIDENDKKMADSWELEKSIGERRLVQIEEETRLSIEAAQEKQDAIVGSLAFIGRSALAENKTFFAITKAANIAQATMDTYAAAQKAMAQLGAWGYPVAAAIVTAGLANVAKIASTSFGGRGSGGGASASATSGAGIGGQGSTFVANQQPRSVQVIVHGNIIDHAAFVRELQPYFREVAIDTV